METRRTLRNCAAQAILSFVCIYLVFLTRWSCLLFSLLSVELIVGMCPGSHSLVLIWEYAGTFSHHLSPVPQMESEGVRLRKINVLTYTLLRLNHEKNRKSE